MLETGGTCIIFRLSNQWTSLVKPHYLCLPKLILHTAQGPSSRCWWVSSRWNHLSHYLMIHIIKIWCDYLLSSKLSLSQFNRNNDIIKKKKMTANLIISLLKRVSALGRQLENYHRAKTEWCFCWLASETP